MIDPVQLHRRTFGNPRVLAGVAGVLFGFALVELFLPLIVNHEALITADPYSYVQFARNLERGHFFLQGEVAEAIQAFSDHDDLVQGPIWNTNVRPDGRSLYTIAIGYPLFLAAMLKVGGMWLLLHVNIVLELLVLLLMVWCVWEGTERSPFGLIVGAGAALILVHSHPDTFRQFSYPWREPLFYACLLTGMIGVLRFGRTGGVGSVALAGAAMGYAVAVKEANALYVLWLCGLVVASPAFRTHPRRVRVLAALAVGGVLGGLPLLVQNALASGNPFLSMQFQRATSHFGSGGQGLAPVHAVDTLSRYLQIYRALPWFHLPWLAVAAGIVAGFRRMPVVRMALGMLVLHLVLYLQWGNADLRHMYFGHVPYAILAALGVGLVIRWAADRVPGLSVYRNWLVVIPLAVLAWWPSPWQTVASRESLFQISDAERMVDRVLSSVNDDRPVLLSNRTLRDVLGTYSDTTVVGLSEVRSFHPENDPFPVLDYWRDRGHAIWFLDNRDLDPRHTHLRRRTEGDAEALRQRYNLRQAGTLEESDDQLGRFLGAGRNVLGLYRVEPWSQTEIARSLPSPGEDGAAFLFLDPRAVGADLEVTVNGVSPEGDPGAYLYLPVTGIDTSTGAVLHVSAGGQPIPDLDDARLVGWGDPIRLPCGTDASPSDHSLFPDGLVGQPDRNLREFKPSFRMRVPVRGGPDWFTSIGLSVNMTGTADRRVDTFVRSGNAAWERFDVANGSAWFPMVREASRHWAGSVDVELRAEPALTWKLNQVKSFTSFRRLSHTVAPSRCGVGLTGFLTPDVHGMGPHPWVVAVNGIRTDSGRCKDNPGLTLNLADRLLTRGDLEPAYEVVLEGAGIIKPAWIEIGTQLDLDMEAPEANLLVAGFYGRERHEGASFRWSGEASVLWVPVVPEALTYQVRLLVADGHPSGGRQVTLSLDGGEPVTLDLPKTRADLAAVVQLPAPRARGMAPLRLSTEAWSPGSLLDNSEDPRTLGFQLYALRWEPAKRGQSSDFAQPADSRGR